jgi:heat shock protein HslJ
VDGASIDIGPAATTRMMCAAEGVMEQESQYLAALEMAEVYRVDGDALELRTADGALAVSYGAQPAAAAGGDEGTTAVASSPSLTGVAWQLQQIQSMDDTVTTPGDPANYTVEFLDDGTVAIQADCNRAAGTYTVDGSQLAIQLGPMTTALCPEGSLSDEFVRNLGDTVSYVFDNGNLYLATKMDGAILEFAPAP